MPVVIALSVFLHGMVIFRGVKFFRQTGECREADKPLAIFMMGMSVMFIITQGIVWADNPWWFILKGSVGMSLMMAFNFANVFFYLALIHNMASNRACRAPQLNTPSLR